MMQTGDREPQAPRESLTPTSPAAASAWETTVAAPGGAMPPPSVPPAGATAATEPGLTPGAATEPAGPARLQRGDAVDLLARLKATLVMLSLVALGVFAALAAFHATGVTARAAASGASDVSGAQATPATQGDDGGFFNQGPNGFGVGQPGLQGPAAGTTVS